MARNLCHKSFLYKLYVIAQRFEFSFHFLNLKTSPLEFISRKIAIISKN